MTERGVRKYLRVSILSQPEGRELLVAVGAAATAAWVSILSQPEGRELLRLPR